MVARIGFTNGTNKLIQDIPSPATTLLPGHFYALTAWYQYRTSLKNDYPAITLNYMDSSGTLAGPYLSVPGHPGETATWQAIKLWFKAQDSPTLRIALGGGSVSGSQGIAWFDDVGFEEVSGYARETRYLSVAGPIQHGGDGQDLSG